MKLVLERFYADRGCTFGLLYVDRDFCCFTLEDPHQSVKVPGKTRIPTGRYKVKPRTLGKWPRRFSERLPWHGQRSLEIVGVPGFTAILFHTGAHATHTSGCILVGNRVNFPTRRLADSWRAYERLARRLLPEIDNGVQIMLSISAWDLPATAHVT